MSIIRKVYFKLLIFCYNENGDGMEQKKGKLIVIEGACDGIGKSTQYNLLYDKLISLGYKVINHHFPSYNTFHGAPVEKYLAGDFGRIDELSPYFINSLYAIDRASAWYLNLKREYESGALILLDRYTTSSIIYQAATVTPLEKRKKFIDDICDYEYNKLEIAKPDMVIFLEAPFDMVTNLRNNRQDYEGNANDIHERDLAFMRQVYDNAIFVADYLKWTKIKCNRDDEMKNVDEIHETILKKVLKKMNHN